MSPDIPRIVGWVRGSTAGQRLSVRHLCECREEDLGGFEASALAELVSEPSGGGASGAAAGL